MSLDVYLKAPGLKVARTGSGIFVRESGATREITRAEWDERFPGREPVVAAGDAHDEWPIYSDNITHNLNSMASAAGIYKELWRPEEIQATHARDLIGRLRDGLARLNSEPERFRALNPDNGWGDYEGLCGFVARYLAACEAYPDAEVSVSR